MYRFEAKSDKISIASFKAADFLMFPGNTLPAASWHRMFDRSHVQTSLRNLMEVREIDPRLIDDVIESGYFLRTWHDMRGGAYSTVSDLMYGNKQLSSSFPIEEFLRCVSGEFEFTRLPEFREYRVNDKTELYAIFSDERRRRYVEDESLTFRGQPREYTLKRKFPNPRRADSEGRELSVCAGIFRQQGEFYSFSDLPHNDTSIRPFVSQLEPNSLEVHSNSSFAYDIPRVEQHYACQTSHLDLTFDLEVASFFATHTFCWNDDGKAYYSQVDKGEHEGVIYCFRDPAVRKSEYMIEGFDLFRTYPPERILRQKCGLPLFGWDERNIAITDVDCIIRLNKEFSGASDYDPQQMFPSIHEDNFYKQLLRLKQQYPVELRNVVEYQWAR